MIERITSLANSKVKMAAKALDAKGDLFVVEGFHMVEMALEKGVVECVFTIEKTLDTKVPQYLVNEQILKKLTTTKTPEGIVALCHKQKPAEITSEHVVYLEKVGDPGNIGTILRTALAFHFYDVVLSKGTAEVYSPKVLMASQGAVFFLNIKQSKNDNPVDDLKELRNAGYHILATDLATSKPLQKLKVPAKTVLMLGNEGKGLSKESISFADQAVRIEMDGIDSLNVGVAGGILMYELSQNKQ